MWGNYMVHLKSIEFWGNHFYILIFIPMLWVWISIRARCTTLCNKVCQWLATGLWFSPGTPVSSINKTNSYYITEILLKVALNTINQTYKINLCIAPIYTYHVSIVKKESFLNLKLLYLILLHRCPRNSEISKWNKNWYFIQRNQNVYSM